VIIKEFRDTLKILGQCMIILALIPILKLLNWEFSHFQWDIYGLWAPVITNLIIIFAVYSGVAVFRAERKDRALEYLLTLPVSRWKVLWSKVAPRLAVLVLLVSMSWWGGILDSPVADGISLIILFLTGVFVSLAVDSMLSAVLGVLVLNIVIYYSSLILSYLIMKYGVMATKIPMLWTSQLLAVVLLLVPMGTAFWLTLKKYEAKPLKWQAKYYLSIALPPVLILLTFILAFLKKYLIWVQI
jgi:ABC-type transport system involved in multi-copper enzyme maturation permease subunit